MNINGEAVVPPPCIQNEAKKMVGISEEIFYLNAIPNNKAARGVTPGVHGTFFAYPEPPDGYLPVYVA